LRRRAMREEKKGSTVRIGRGGGGTKLLPPFQGTKEERKFALERKGRERRRPSLPRVCICTACWKKNREGGKGNDDASS